MPKTSMSPISTQAAFHAAEMENPLHIVQQQLDDVAAFIGLPKAAHTLLRNPLREFKFQFPVKMDDGATQIFQGFRVQWNDAVGPAKGGLRFHPAETIDTVRALAAWMTWKTAVMELPLGGGKGGVICNPKELSSAELERVSRGYMRTLARMVGPELDIPAPDVYTTPQVMAWMMDEYETILGHHAPGIITGKPIMLGGSLGRGDATARGGIYVLREAAQVLNLDLAGKTAAIQGYGNAGAFAHQLAVEILGMKVVAVSDSRGGIFDPDGLVYDQVVDHKARTGSVINFPDTQPITNADLLEMDVMVLFPAALENVITEANAPQIKAKFVAELANGPTTPEADEILFANGIFVLPDILCNAGGVTVSYFEQVQNAYDYYWDEELVHERLDTKMRRAFRNVYDVAQAREVHNRKAAQILAVERVYEAMKLRGWV